MSGTFEFRDLRADEIEVRVSTCRQNGVSLLLYKDARVDMRILDETVMPQCWQKRFYEMNDTLFCSVGLYVGSDCGGWVWKDDAGEPSNMSAQKGEASDAFKRACFNWGIGRELYTAPFIWVPAERCTIKQGSNGRPQCFDRFSVSKIQIERKEITGVRINNDTKGCVAYSWKRQSTETK